MLLAPAARAAAASGSDSVGFAVSPLRFEVDVPAGTTSTHQITITNTDDRATTYTFSKEDFQGDKDEPAATPVLLGGKFDSAISGFDWLSVPDQVTIAGGDSKTVTIKVAAPTGATGGHYAAVFVNGPTQMADEVSAQSRMGVLFMMNAGGVPPPDIVITEVVERTDGGTKVVYTNEGQTATKPKPTITTKDPVTGKPVKRQLGTCTTALPGGSGECNIPKGGGSGSSSTGGGTTVGLPGKRYVDLTDEDTGAKTGAALPTEWSGTWSSLLLPLVGIALFVLYFLFLRRRRKKGEEDEDVDGTGFDDPWATAPLS